MTNRGITHVINRGRKDGGGTAAAGRDVVVDSYRTILTELGLLTTVSVLLFGFLLTTANRESLSTAEHWLLFVALVSVATATVVFVLPIAYHRMQFPYEDWEKFQMRAHAFITLGFPFFLAGFYTSLTLAIWDLFGLSGLAVAAAPLAIGWGVLAARRYVPWGNGEG